MRLWSDAAVLAAGVYLVALGLAALIRPEQARKFLSAFASSAATHYTEVFVRFVLGAAIIVAAPQMRFATGFTTVGWVIVGTTVVLLCVPWRWHQRFSDWSVPQALRFMPLFAVASLAAGAFVLYALLQ